MKKIQTIIVSGGSKGLGQGIVEYLLKADCNVATFSRKKSSFIEKTIASHSETFHWQALDGSDCKELKKFARNIYDKYGSVDGLINNVGTSTDGILTTIADSDIDLMFNVNLRGVIHLTQECTKYMLIQNSGTIINISSIIGTRGYRGLSVYSATKGGLDAFTRSLARELGARKIRVNSIAPGYLETEMTGNLSTKQRQQIIRRTPLQRLGKVEDVVGVVKFLLSEDAQFITGQTIVIDGGFTC